MEEEAARLFPAADATSAAHRAKDWSRTPLGPVATWSAELRAAVRTVLPSRAPMLLWWGPELVQIFNHAYTPVLGAKYPEAVGQSGRECWAEVWDEVGPLAERVLDGGGAPHRENQRLLLRRHGYLEETYWTYSYSPVRAEDGSVAGIFVATADVTARVLGERRLETLRRLGALSVTKADNPADACRAAVAVLAGSTADLPVVSAHLRSAGGLEPVASTGEAPWADVVLDAVRRVGATGCAERVALPAGPVAQAVVAPLAAHGGTAGVLVVGISPYREFDRSYAGFVDLVVERVATAVDDAMALTAERARAAALAELDAAKTRFFQNVGHEFRTPLTLLLSPLRALLDEPGAALSADRLEAVSVAHRAALRLGRLVDSLLDVASAEAGTLRARPEPTDAAALTAECADMFRPAVEQAGLELVVDVEPAGGAVALDQEMWVRIVLNLLSNAVKFTLSGTVSVTLRTTRDELVLRVADTGLGIPTAEQERVFERFHRVHGAVGRSGEGTGIGLALVADLARALGGGVSVASAPGAGSTFTVVVPRVAVAPRIGVDARPRPPELDEVAAAFLAEARQWAPLEPSGEPARDPARGRVLLVEDNADMRAHLVALLRGQGWAVDAVGDAGAALALLRSVRPDLVLSDVMLPGRDGLALLREVRGDRSLSRTPVVLLTARAGAESAVAALGMGADDYVVKPFDPAELVARLRAHLELSRLRELLIAEREREASTLRTALDSRGTISQAVGILMALHRCDGDAAFGRLVGMSQRGNRKLREVAQDLVRQFTASVSAGADR